MTTNSSFNRNHLDSEQALLRVLSYHAPDLLCRKYEPNIDEEKNNHSAQVVGLFDLLAHRSIKEMLAIIRTSIIEHDAECDCMAYE